MKIKNDTFYVLDIENEREAFQTEEDAVETLQDSVGDDTDPDSVSIWEVSVGSDQWDIQEIPWSNIAIQLMKGD